MAKTVVLGFDGMDFDYMQSIIGDLPRIYKLSQSSIVSPFESVFPPDSIPSWITCFTGRDPSEHGILETINYLAKDDARLSVNASAFQGKTFWDIIGDSGYTVNVINPFMCYPVWSVNGLMVNGPVFIDGNIQVSDQTFVGDASIPNSLGGITDFPTKKTLNDFVKKTLKDTEEQVDFGLSLLLRNKPDLFFQTFLTTDRIQHFLWRYCDRSDPTYPGDTEFIDVIRDFYCFIDSIIGKFIDVLGPEDRLIVISDHGHGMRCTHCFNINEFLRQRGDLFSSASGTIFSKKLIVEITKNYVLDFMHTFDLEDYISTLAKFVPNAKEIKKGKHITDSSRNKAFVSDFTGTNPFGGICINKELVSDYAQFRSELIHDFLTVRHEGKLVVDWALPREEMFSGSYIDRFPDILFALDPKYGVNWNLHTKLFTINPTHKKISGGHKSKGVFISNISADTLNGNDVSMNNFFGTLLHIFKIMPPNHKTFRSFLN